MRIEFLRRSWPTILSLLIIFSVLSSSPNVGGADFIVARVVEVQYPPSARSGQRLSIVVVAEYADRVLVDVGLFDPSSFEMLNSLTLISTFAGPGRASFTFDLTAPAAEGLWKLVAMTRAWWLDAWAADPQQGSKAFSIAVTNRSKLTLRSEISNSWFRVDGKELGSSANGTWSINLRVGSHTLEAKPVIDLGRGARAIFSSWSDGIASNPREVFLQKDQSLTAGYKIQFWLEVNSEFAKAVGSGWYDKGTVARFAITTLKSGGRSFAGWSGSVSAKDQAASVAMDGPREVHAVWIPIDDNFRADNWLWIAAAVFLATTAIFIARSEIRRVHSNRKIVGAFPFVARHVPQSGFLLLGILALASVSIFALPIPVEGVKPLSIKFGDASWYYWDHAKSDSCILWLGGGTIEASLALTINPYEFESFNTIRFVQELASNYCLVALERGTGIVRDLNLNRTIHVQPYPSGIRYLQEIRGWLLAQGHSYVYLVGYSVGGLAALKEAMLNDPVGWATPNGLVLITVPFNADAIQFARGISSNLLLLYGNRMPADFVDTGRQLFAAVPAEGQMRNAWLHKELHVLSDVAHEVWTLAETGRYDFRATKLVVSFIESAKKLQYQQQAPAALDFLRSPQTGQSTRIALKLSAPARASLNTVLTLQLSLQNIQNASSSFLAMIFDTETKTLATTLRTRSIQDKTELLARLVTPQNRGKLNLAVVLFEARSGSWSLVADALPARIGIDVTDSILLRIRVGHPNVIILIDGSPASSDQTGLAALEVSPGQHQIIAPEIVSLGRTVRLIFSSWDDGTTSPSIKREILEDTSMGTFYRTQFLLEVESSFGMVNGAGWHDANSTTTIQLSIIWTSTGTTSSDDYVFDGWTGNAGSQSPSETLFFDAPKKLVAKWSPLIVNEGGTDLTPISTAILSAVLLFSIVLMDLRKKF